MNISNLEIIKTQEKWNALLSEIGNFDFYHTYDYHKLDNPKDGYIVMLKYTENEILIGLPLLIRKIVDTNYFDATSVYGYAGPISKNITEEFDNSKFKSKLHAFFEEHNIISVFSRLHPYIENQKTILRDYGQIINQGKVVNLDLNLSPHNQNKKYQERLRTYINSSRRNCIIKKLETDEELHEFIRIYHKNMERVNANEYFFFNEDYFKGLLASTQFNAEIFLVKDIKSNNMVAGSLFVTTNNIVQYHLSGIRLDYSYLTPVKLLIDEMRVIASKRDLQFYNLGGGKGGNSNDSLFRFKSSFSKDFRVFNIWNLIINQSIYCDLVEKQGVTNTSFFPEYRHTDKNLVSSAD